MNRDKLNTLNTTQLNHYVQLIESFYNKKVARLFFDGSRLEQWTLDVDKDGTLTRNVKPEIDIEVSVRFTDGTVVTIMPYDDLDVENIDFWAEEIALSA